MMKKMRLFCNSLVKHFEEKDLIQSGQMFEISEKISQAALPIIAESQICLGTADNKA